MASRDSRHVRALIFDFDGLIVDSESPDLASWSEAFAAHGCTLPLETWLAVIGTATHTFDPYALLEQQLGRAVDRDVVRAERRRRFLELVATQPLLPGVAEYIAGARERGLARGIASSATREWVVGQLARLGILNDFDVVLCQDDVARAKPDPELYRAALRLLDVRPDEAIAFEDSPNGIAAAAAAGVFCVAAPNAVTRRLDLSRADLVVPSLADLALSDLIGRVEGSRHAIES